MKVLYEIKDKIAFITINRPEVLNAMDGETYHLLSKAWTDVRDNPDVWVAIVTGAGEKSFTVGADLRAVAVDFKVGKDIPTMFGPKADLWQTQKDQLLNRGLEVWKPVIAAINGYCMAGGMTLAFATDFRIAAEHATFEISEVKRSLLAGNGGCVRALKQFPFTIAMEMLLLGRRLTAQEALEYKFLNRVVPLKHLMTTAEEYARRLCEMGPLAVRAIKELAIKSQYMRLEDALRLEQAMMHHLTSTEDAKEGVAAFIEKRTPVFKGE
jgi:E-phenylitaconyl-CoA hydratase